MKKNRVDILVKPSHLFYSADHQKDYKSEFRLKFHLQF
jgi:hypothetical protein